MWSLVLQNTANQAITLCAYTARVLENCPTLSNFNSHSKLKLEKYCVSVVKRSIAMCTKTIEMLSHA